MFIRVDRTYQGLVFRDRRDDPPPVPVGVWQGRDLEAFVWLAVEERVVAFFSTTGAPSEPSPPRYCGAHRAWIAIDGSYVDVRSSAPGGAPPAEAVVLRRRHHRFHVGVPRYGRPARLHFASHWLCTRVPAVVWYGDVNAVAELHLDGRVVTRQPDRGEGAWIDRMIGSRRQSRRSMSSV